MGNLENSRYGRDVMFIHPDGVELYSLEGICLQPFVLDSLSAIIESFNFSNIDEGLDNLLEDYGF